MSYTKSTTALLAVGVIAVWSLVAAKAIKWLRPSGEPVVHGKTGRIPLFLTTEILSLEMS